jgi:hypothetical protein
MKKVPEPDRMIDSCNTKIGFEEIEVGLPTDMLLLLNKIVRTVQNFGMDIYWKEKNSFKLQGTGNASELQLVSSENEMIWRR